MSHADKIFLALTYSHDVGKEMVEMEDMGGDEDGGGG